MAQFQSEIELRVKVIDKELRDLEKRAQKIQNTNPFSASGGRRGASQAQKQTAALKAQRAELELINRATKQQSIEQIKLLNKRTAWLKVLREGKQISKDIAAATEKEAKAAAKVAANRKKDRNKAIGSAASGALISAAFPILTGGGAAESALGGIGGLLGSAFGPLGSFAGGIGGSALGRLITDAEELNKSLVQLNTSLGDVGSTSAFTADDISKLAKQLNIAKEDAIGLAGELNAFVLPSEIEDVAKLFGPVGGAATLEAVAKAAESEAAALEAIDGLRGQISRKTAEQLVKVLEIEGSEAAQAALLDALTEKSENLTEETAKIAGFWETISAAILTASSGQLSSLGIGDFVPVTPEDVALDAAGIVPPKQSVINKALNGFEEYLKKRNALREQYNPKKERTGGGRAAALPQSKELQLRQQILKTELSLADIETKRRALQATDLAAIKIQDQALYERLATQTQILELARQQALVSSKVPEDAILINELFDQRLEKLQRENDLQREQNLLKGEQLKLQQALTALRNKQQTEGIVQGLERSIEDANSRGSSEMLSLRIKQLRRQEDLIGGITDKIEEQNKIIASGDAKKIPAAQAEIEALETRKAAIEALLPALNQAEQQQLKFNQAFAAVAPAVNSLVGGLREVVAGTKTAEEAFADFLTTIADQLINTAATMIAQYIAIGIARMFAMGQQSGGGIPFGGGSDLGIASGGGFGSSFFGLAEGGYVTGPTKAFVGEGGEPEYVIPESKMNGAMQRWNGGTRGGDVVSGADSGSGGEGVGSTSSGPTNVIINGGVTQMGGTDYIRKDEIPSIVAQASKQGEAMTLRRLQMSPGTRRKLGM